MKSSRSPSTSPLKHQQGGEQGQERVKNGILNRGNSFSSTEDDSALDEAQERIIATLTLKYTECDSSHELLSKTIEHLRENIKAGICLICIEDVERTESIWSCQNCYCILHLVCIQRWSKDSISNVKEAAAQKGFNLPIIWCCPKCRGEYGENEYPQNYSCFCGKLANPPPDPWNAPHSCGDACGKPLKPECGHNCLLLCHSGPCPPCPKQVECSCYCGVSPPKTLRCFSKSWSCGKVCSKDLECGFHRCLQICHETKDCLPCFVPVTLTCKCSSPSPVTINCSEVAVTSARGGVSCGNCCGKVLNCGVHNCEKICHGSIPCPDCKQSCPCGKRQVECSGLKGSTGLGREKCCEDTCGKTLDCGEHMCEQKCHAGGCGSCLQWVTKKCKCGAFEKEISCSKEFVCTNKCRRLRDCGVHPCNKKCCPGDCPPCRNVCGKSLSCKNHKCESICHRGPCYPCPVSASVKCRCASTVRLVPCGSERKCKPPACNLFCELKTKCDHPAIQRHKCHFGECPRCKLICEKEMKCGHSCPAMCHTLKDHKRNCPNCLQRVPSLCQLHGSTGVQVECCKKEKPCEEICGKSLTCGFHYCRKICHERITTGDFGCGECRDSCSKARPVGCEHECPLGCHSGQCPECNLVSKVQCHCGSETLFVICSAQSKLPEAEQSCKNQCPKKLACGHRCLSICHLGDCPELERCRRKVKLSCKCKHLKKDIECFLVNRENKTLECLEPTCVIPKSPSKFCNPNPTPDTPEGTIGTGKKRNRKKKSSENEKAMSSEQSELDQARADELKSRDNTGRGSILVFGTAAAVVLVCVLGLSYFVGLLE